MRGMWTDDASLQIIKQKTMGTENKTIGQEIFYGKRNWIKERILKQNIVSFIEIW